jgi:hypothetical protein
VFNSLGLGVVPPLIVLVPRIYMKTSERYAKEAMKGRMPWGLIVRRYWRPWLRVAMSKSRSLLASITYIHLTSCSSRHSLVDLRVCRLFCPVLVPETDPGAPMLFSFASYSFGIYSSVSLTLIKSAMPMLTWPVEDDYFVDHSQGPCHWPGRFV